jgi:hypothetical protein
LFPGDPATTDIPAGELLNADPLLQGEVDDNDEPLLHGEADDNADPLFQGELDDDQDVLLIDQGEATLDQGEPPDVSRRNPHRAARDRPGPHGKGGQGRLNIADHRVRFLDPDSRELFFKAIDWTTPIDDPQDTHFGHLMLVCTHPISKEVYYQHLLALAAKASAADNPTLCDIMRLPEGTEKSDWFEAMDKKLDELMAKHTSPLVKHSAANGHEITLSTWTFKR